MNQYIESSYFLLPLLLRTYQKDLCRRAARNQAVDIDTEGVNPKPKAEFKRSLYQTTLHGDPSKNGAHARHPPAWRACVSHSCICTTACIGTAARRCTAEYADRRLKTFFCGFLVLVYWII